MNSQSTAVTRSLISTRHSSASIQICVPKKDQVPFPWGMNASLERNLMLDFSQPLTGGGCRIHHFFFLMFAFRSIVPKSMGSPSAGT